MKNFIIIILLIAIGFGLYITNPTRDDFDIFIEEEMRKEFDTSDNDTIMNLISGAIASLTGKAASTIATRDDYYLFSIYTVRIADEESKYIGIFKKFIPMPEI